MATARTPKPDARRKLLDVALRVIREQGYAATTVDDLCRAAGVTKGGFFHHFASKEALAVAAAAHWTEVTSAVFADAPYHDESDPLDRVLGYVAFRRALLRGSVPEFTCLVGTMVQETYRSSDAIRGACDESITDHASRLVADIEAAVERHGSTATFTAESLATYTQAVIQGAFVLAKARGGPEVAAESLAHLEQHLRLLIPRKEPRP